MKLPFLEEIYDYDTEMLIDILQKLNTALEDKGRVPEGYESYEKFERKALKLKDCIELELNERQNMDDVLNYFVNYKEDDLFKYYSDNTSDRLANGGLEKGNDQYEEVKENTRTMSYLPSYTINPKIESSSNKPINEGAVDSIDNQSVSTESSSDMFANASKKKATMNKKQLFEFMKKKLERTSQNAANTVLYVGKSTVNRKPTIKKVKEHKSVDAPSKEEKKKHDKVINKPVVRDNIGMRRQSFTANSSKRDLKNRENTTKVTHIEHSKKHGIANKKISTGEERRQQDKKEGILPELAHPAIERNNKKKETHIKSSNTQNIKLPDIFEKDKPKDTLPKRKDITPNKKEKTVDVERVETVNNDEEFGIEEYLGRENIANTVSSQEEGGEDLKVQVVLEDTATSVINTLEECEEEGGDEEEEDQEQEYIEEECTNHENNENNEHEVIELENNEQINNELENNNQENNEEENNEQIVITNTHDDIGTNKISNNQIEETLETRTDIDSESEAKDHELFEFKVSPTGEIIKNMRVIPNKNIRDSENVQEIENNNNDNKKNYQGLTSIESSVSIMSDTTPDNTNLLKKVEFVNTISDHSEKLNIVHTDMEILQSAQIINEPSQELTSRTNDEKSEKKGGGKKLNKIDSTKAMDQKPVENANKKQEIKRPPQARVAKKRAIQSKAAMHKELEMEQSIDYSRHYKSFYDIFVGSILDPKHFDPAFIFRDTKNTYTMFSTLLDNKGIFFGKHQFEDTPLEKAYSEYTAFNTFLMTKKNLNEKELELKNRDNEILINAINQAQLKERFKSLKNENEINNAEAGNGSEKKVKALIDFEREPTLFFRVVKNRVEVYDIVTRAFSRKKRWNELPHGLDLRNSWNLLWTWSKIKIDISKILVWQKVNHFSQNKNLSRKDYLKKNIERVQKIGQKCANVFNIIPKTYVLPKEYLQFVESFAKDEETEGKYNYWIMKPCAKSRGRGISLINDIGQIMYGEPVLLQKYMKSPILLDGYKFDLRIYALVTSFNPLEAFIYKEGFARFSTVPFNIDPEHIDNRYMHLTNVAVQKQVSDIGGSNVDFMDERTYGGTKICLQTLKKKLEARGIDYDKIWQQVIEIVNKALVACQNDIVYHPCCFELFGYDIMIDSNLKCWLIEVNSSPSLARDNVLDDIVKQALVDDIIDLVNPIDFDRKRLVEVLERRLGDEAKMASNSSLGSLKKMMNRDLTYILNGQEPRVYGEMPKLMGNFDRIAPTEMSDRLIKLVGGQKMFGVGTKTTSF